MTAALHSFGRTGHFAEWSPTWLPHALDVTRRNFHEFAIFKNQMRWVFRKMSRGLNFWRWLKVGWKSH